jgi:hypothetical protein
MTLGNYNHDTVKLMTIELSGWTTSFRPPWFVNFGIIISKINNLNIWMKSVDCNRSGVGTQPGLLSQSRNETCRPRSPGAARDQEGCADGNASLQPCQSSGPPSPMSLGGNGSALRSSQFHAGARRRGQGLTGRDYLAAEPFDCDFVAPSQDPLTRSRT